MQNAVREMIDRLMRFAVNRGRVRMTIAGKNSLGRGWVSVTILVFAILHGGMAAARPPSNAEIDSGPFRPSNPPLSTAATLCDPEWAAGFEFGGFNDGQVDANALAVFDDGRGLALYAGGSFTTAGGLVANRIAKWDGSTWSALGSGMNGLVNALTVFDNALYAGGSFSTAGGVTVNYIAKWNPSTSTWSGLGGGMNGTVNALTVFDNALYAGGGFTTAGGVTVSYIAKWNPSTSTWSGLGSGMNSTVNALTVFGNALYAGGSFTAAGGVTVNRIARWNGSTWSPLGGGMNSTVYAFTVFDDGFGAGPALYAGGSFTMSGKVAVNYIARWDGTLWSPLGSGMGGTVYGLTVFNDGTGAALYAGGSFSSAGGVAGTSRIAKWKGVTWESVDGGTNNTVSALGVFNDGTGLALYAGGAFTTAGGRNALRIAKWNGAKLLPLGHGANDRVRAMTTYDDVSGRALYVGGEVGFTVVDQVIVNSIAKWNGSTWSSLRSGMDNAVYALAVFDNALYAGGSFTTAGGVTANRIARWNGATWSPLIVGAQNGVNSTVRAFAVYDDGTGAKLCAGGDFTSAGGVSASRIACWNGASWSALGTGINGTVNALAVYGEGAGPNKLFAAGSFTMAGGVSALNIARWTPGTPPSWSPVGTGANGVVNALTVLDSCVEPRLCAGGIFTLFASVPVNYVACWNGTSGSALGAGFNNEAKALTVFDDHTGSSGRALYAGGKFTSSGGTTTINRIAKWNCSAWEPLTNGVGGEGVTSPWVWAMGVYNDTGGSALYVGGDFNSAGALSSGHIARWGCNGECGDGVCNGAEDCTTCPSDCACVTNGDCDDGNPCTIDRCTAGCCVNAPECTTSADCPDDGVFCNGTEVCQAGCCIAGTPPCGTGQCCDEVANACQPGPSCTLDSQCNDNDPCTTDHCINGCCSHSPVPCCGPCPTPLTIGGAIYSNCASPLTTGISAVDVCVTCDGGFHACTTTVGSAGLWHIDNVPCGHCVITPAELGWNFCHVTGACPPEPNPCVPTAAIDVCPQNEAQNQSIQFLGQVPPCLLGDMNCDGFRSIIGDVPPFVDCVYRNSCACPCPWPAPCVPPGDCNCDGFLSIVGDVPCFVDCVYFALCSTAQCPCSTTADVSDESGSTIGGAVYDNADDPLFSGLEGMEISVRSDDGTIVATTTSGTLGLWRVDGLPDGEYTILFRSQNRDGSDRVDAKPIVVSTQNKEANQSIVLERSVEEPKTLKPHRAVRPERGR